MRADTPPRARGVGYLFSSDRCWHFPSIIRVGGSSTPPNSFQLFICSTSRKSCASVLILAVCDDIHAVFTRRKHTTPKYVLTREYMADANDAILYARVYDNIGRKCVCEIIILQTSLFNYYRSFFCWWCVITLCMLYIV